MRDCDCRAVSPTMPERKREGGRKGRWGGGEKEKGSNCTMYNMLPAIYLSASIGVEEGSVWGGKKMARKCHCRVEVDLNSSMVTG